MNELFTNEIERFIQKTYGVDSVVFQEIIFEEPNRKVISLVYYYDQTLESDMYEIVHSMRLYSEPQTIQCESVGRFSERQPNLEEIASLLRHLLRTYV